MHAGKVLYVCFAALSLAQELPRAGVQEPAAGEILVATTKSHDPDLARSVILLIQYDRDGAIGLMLNRPNGKAFEGGPIDLGVRTLVRSRSKPEGAQRVFGDVYIYPRMVNATGARIYLGYTGWSAQQLKDEIARGLWKPIAGDARVVFDRDPATLSKRLNR
ncbi:MAG TPA: YqgE/AlgH family protein [Bryobacteraceae bacterium]|nr:YqgE/AlgH family protein [Bryobacteraceae bacterium]